MKGVETKVRHFPDLGTLRVSGPDRVSWLNGLVTADVAACAPGKAVWSLALDRKGKIQSELWVLEAGDSLLIATAAGTTAAMAETLEKLLIMEDCELSDVSADHRWSLLVGDPPPEDRSDSAVWGALPGMGLAATAWCAPRDIPSAWIDAQATYTDEAWLQQRLEANLPAFGVDYGQKDRPHEAALERRTVSWSKGCYLGQEVVCMQDMRGKVSRAVRRLLVRAPASAPLGQAAAVWIGGESVAQLSSVAFSPARDGWLGFAQLPLGKLRAGELGVGDPVRAYAAELLEA
jgi:folate-binding protein YgfZ